MATAGVREGLSPSAIPRILQGDSISIGSWRLKGVCVPAIRLGLRKEEINACFTYTEVKLNCHSALEP
jgi:hypothetical protein